MCTFGIIFTNDTFKEKPLSKDYAISVAKYVAVFVDLTTYYPEICLEYDDLELALACVICSRKHKSVYPNSNPYLFSVYGAGLDQEKVEVATLKIWSKYEQMSKKQQSTIVGKQIHKDSSIGKDLKRSKLKLTNQEKNDSGIRDIHSKRKDTYRC